MVYDRRVAMSFVETNLRRLLLAVLIVGLGGVTLDLWAIEHHEDSWQLVPIFLNVAALFAAGWQVAAPSRLAILAMRAVMLLMVVSAGIGMTLHYQGNAEFQLEMNPDLAGWDLFQKVIHAKAPPTLAPGVMAQLGLLGLIYTYAHPAARLRQPGGSL